MSRAARGSSGRNAWRGGLFQAPDVAPTERRIRLRPGMAPRHLGFAVIRSAGRYAVAGATLLVLFNGANVLVPVVLGAAVDRGIEPVTSGTPWRQALPGFAGWLGLLVLLYVVTNLTFRFGGRLGWYGVQRAQHELSELALARLLHPRGIDGPLRRAGTALSIATLDVQRACLALYVAIYPVGELVAVVVASVSLFLIHPLLGLGVVVGAPVLLVVMAFVAAPLQRRSEVEQERVADATDVATDLVSGYRVIAGLHAQEAARRRYRTVSRAALQGTLAARTAQGGFEGVNGVLSGLFSAAVTVGAAVLAFRGQISIGGLIAAAGVAQVLLYPLQSLVGEAGSRWALAMGSAGRVLELLSAPERTDSQGRAEPPPPTPLALRLAGLPLREGTLDLDVRTGEFVVLDLSAADSMSLAGALSLSELPGGGTPALAGRIRLHGAALDTLDPAALRAQVLVAPHSADLFDDTVLANVVPALHGAAQRAAEGSAAELRARAALTVAHAASLEDDLPDGLLSRVGEAGRALSGGQRQRVALARAVATEAPVLVLHDPTSAIDSVTEVAIARRLRCARAGSTTIVLTSSPAFAAVADRTLRPDPDPDPDLAPGPDPAPSGELAGGQR